MCNLYFLKQNNNFQGVQYVFDLRVLLYITQQGRSISTTYIRDVCKQLLKGECFLFLKLLVEYFLTGQLVIKKYAELLKNSY